MDWAEKHTLYLNTFKTIPEHFRLCSLRQRMRALPRSLWLMVVSFYLMLPYTHVMTLVAPLYYYNTQWYYAIEEQLYSWMTHGFASLFTTCGHTVREYGADISQLYDTETLFLFNHVTGADLFLLNYIMGLHSNVVKKGMTIMFYAIKWSCYGPCFLNHDDFFISQGKSTIIDLEKHLKAKFKQRGKKWLILFPEGNLLWNGRTSSEKYAKKEGLPVPQKVLIPRTGAFTTIMDTLTSSDKDSSTLKYIVDVSLAYPDPSPDSFNIFMDILPPTEIKVLYRIFPISALPRDTDKQNDWLMDLWREKDKNIQYYKKTGQFPNVKSQCENDNPFPEREHTLQVNPYFILSLHICFIACTCLFLLSWAFVLKTVLMMF